MSIRLLINLKLHRTLLLGDIGKQQRLLERLYFSGHAGLGFRAVAPETVAAVAPSLTIKWRAKKAKRTYNLHSVLGFYAIPFLLVIVATGINMASHGDKKEEKPVVYPAFRPGLVADNALASVLKSDAFETVRINLPKDSQNPLRVVISKRRSRKSQGTRVGTLARQCRKLCIHNMDSSLAFPDTHPGLAPHGTR